jgi:hypothetical protein
VYLEPWLDGDSADQREIGNVPGDRFSLGCAEYKRMDERPRPVPEQLAGEWR